MIELLWPSVCAGCETRGEGLLCPHCRPRALHRPPLEIAGIRGVFSASGYPSAAGRALRVAKYGRRRPLLLTLAEDFAAALGPTLAKGDITAVVPVPASWQRRLERGFAPASMLADALARRIGAPCLEVITAAAGPRQAGLDATSRRRNLEGRIRCKRTMRGRILLVDDVVTTGATAEACARELLGSGAEAVWLATLCAARVTPVQNL